MTHEYVFQATTVQMVVNGGTLENSLTHLISQLQQEVDMEDMPISLLAKV